MPVLHTLEDEKLIKITSKENLLHTAYLNQAADLCMDLLREYHAKKSDVARHAEGRAEI